MVQKSTVAFAGTVTAGILFFTPMIVRADVFRSDFALLAEVRPDTILSFGPEAVAASLVDVLAERDPEQLAELAELIRRRLAEPQ